jgi:hypothetical protein
MLLERWMLTAMRTKILAVPVVALLATSLIWGQDQLPQPQGAPGAEQGDSPENGVARISFVQGNVSVRQGSSAEQTAAAINGPLMKDGAVITGENSQAEIQLDAINFLRVAPGSEVRFGDLQYHRYPIQIALGTATYRMLRDSDAEIEISLPAVAVRPTRAGSYRITVQPDGQGQITALSGEAEVYSAKGSQNLSAGQMMMVRGTEDNPEFQIVAAPGQDDFDRFNDRRDADLNRAVSPRYVSPDIYGTEQLDANGTWTNDPAYGNVWVPRVDPGWAPYRDGRWVYEPYYGWTWVSSDPWGWAPYHYGSWYQGAYGWAWYPGPFVGRHYWRPALVGFFGWGGGVGVGVGFGYANVGWVPLAPHEIYRPWYGRSGVNIVANVNVVNTYRNARFEHAITSVHSGDFGRGAIRNDNFVRPSMSEIARGGAVRGALPLTPARDSFRMSDRAVNTQGMPRTNQSERFFSRGSSSVAAGNRGQVIGGQSNGGQSNAGQSNGWRRLDGPSSSNGQTANGQISGRTSNNFGNRSPQVGGAQGNVTPGNSSTRSGGWQRLDTPTGQSGYRGTVSGQSAPATNTYRQPSAQPAGQRQVAPQQPVRISPSIVRDRGTSGGSRTDVHGGFGGAHPSGGGGGGGRPSGGGNGGGHSSNHGR